MEGRSEQPIRLTPRGTGMSEKISALWIREDILDLLEMGPRGESLEHARAIAIMRGLRRLLANPAV